MKIYKLLIKTISIAILGSVIYACSDDEKDLPDTFALSKAVTITPKEGALLVEWTPDPKNSNMAYLNIKMTDQDGVFRQYNISSVGSSLIPKPEFETDEEEIDPESLVDTRPEKISLLIDKLISQNYSLNFTAYNNYSKGQGLGSLTAKPLDHHGVIPDSVYNVKADIVKGKMILTWDEMKPSLASTYKGVRFNIYNTNTEESKTFEYERGFANGFRRDSIPAERATIYEVTYETFSEAGAIWTNPANVILAEERPTKIELTTDQITTNAQETSEGSVAALLDGAISTFYHSSWSKQINDPYGHYIDVKLEYPVSTIQYQYTTREQNGNAAPEHIILWGSNDGVNFNKLDEQEGGFPVTAKTEYKSPLFELDQPYSHIRWAVVRSKQGGSMITGYGYFVISEFSLHSFD